MCVCVYVREESARRLGVRRTPAVWMHYIGAHLRHGQPRRVPALLERMARDGKVSLGRKQITMQLGQLFVDRASINLHSDILDNPDYFWEDDEWLPAYARVAKYLEITRRAEVLNKRLDIIKELFDMLASEYHNSHASMLEWIIIVLIVIEVFFQVVSLCLDGTTGI